MLRPGRVGRIGAALAVVLVTGCGVADAEGDRARMVSQTCLSTIARNGLPEPVPDLIAAEVFAAEYQRLLDRGERFDTTRPYRNVCREIRDEIRAEQAAAAVLGDDEEAGDQP